jgi:hypothetical protein
MYVKAIKVKYISDYTLEITFDNGDKGIVDFSSYAKRGGVFSRFDDLEYFKRVTIDPVWECSAGPEMWILLLRLYTGLRLENRRMIVRKRRQMLK